MLNFLNAAKTPKEIADAIEIPGEKDTSIKIATRILAKRKEIGGFRSLKQVDEVPQVGPERFSHIVETLGAKTAKMETERTQFKNLISLNPNYFGNINVPAVVAEFSPVCPMANNVSFEQLVCVGLYPEDNTLAAIVEIKKPLGYNGPLCQQGSKEYVAFYIDYNDGAGFVSVGAPAEVNVHDLSFVDGDHLYYAVRKPFTPKQYLECGNPQIVKVKAILSWESIPTGPNFDPVWGNALERWVQIKPEPKDILFYPVVAVGNTMKYAFVGDLAKVKNLVDHSIAVEQKIKAEGKLEKERVEFKKLIDKNPNYFGSISKSAEKNLIMKAVKQLPTKTTKTLLSMLTIDPNLLVPVSPYNQKTTYEELKCVGLYPESDLLEAVIEVKLPYGFNGDLCSLGSMEYVAFYIDWGTGYEYAATATVSSHDIPAVNEKHLFYSAMATISGIESKLKTCSQENVVKVKAILSWNTDPTPYGPDYAPAWGNAIIRDIQIRPKDGSSAQCKIEIVSDVHVDDIVQSGTIQGLAIKIDKNANTVPGTFDRPFGGVIACWGNINVPNAAYYRFRYSANGGATWNNVKDNRVARTVLGFTLVRSPDGEGWFSKSDYDADVANYSLTSLVQWASYGKEGTYQLRLELADASKTPLPGQTCDVYIKLDNTYPELLAFGGTPTPLPASGVVVKDNAGFYRKCTEFMGSEAIKIFCNFKDSYFSSYSLVVFGGNIAASGVGIGSGRYDPEPASPDFGKVDDEGIVGAVSGGLGQELKTLNLCTVNQVPAKVKCAYGIQLGVWDRSIVGYMSGYEFWKTSHYVNAFVTFDWNPSGCPP